MKYRNIRNIKKDVSYYVNHKKKKKKKLFGLLVQVNKLSAHLLFARLNVDNEFFIHRCTLIDFFDKIFKNKIRGTVRCLTIFEIVFKRCYDHITPATMEQR